MSTTLDLLQAATLSLARPGSIKERLTDACCNHLALIEESDLPMEVCEEFRALTNTLARERPLLRGEDAARATIRKMSNEEAGEVACAVVRLYGTVSRATTVSMLSKNKKNSVNVVPFYVAEA